MLECNTTIGRGVNSRIYCYVIGSNLINYCQYHWICFNSQGYYLDRCRPSHLHRCPTGTCPSDCWAPDQVTSHIFWKGTQLGATHKRAPLFFKKDWKATGLSANKYPPDCHLFKWIHQKASNYLDMAGTCMSAWTTTVSIWRGKRENRRTVPGNRL